MRQHIADALQALGGLAFVVGMFTLGVTVGLLAAGVVAVALGVLVERN